MIDPNRKPEEQEEDDASERSERDAPEDLDVDADDATQVMGGRMEGRSGTGAIPMAG